MRWNAARKPGLYRRVGLACGLSVVDDTGADADRKTVAFVTNFLKTLGLGDGLAARGVREDQLGAITDVAFADPCHKTNVLPVTREDLAALLKEAMS
jgi:alcohol dehydrogenase class IV